MTDADRRPHADIGEILLTEEQIAGARSPSSARASRADYAGRPLTLVIGAQGLAAVHGRPDAGHRPAAPDRPHGGQLVRRQHDRVVGLVRILKDLSASIEGEDVLIVEDIIDTGLTLNYLIRYLRGKNPATLRICTLLDKPARRLVEIPVDYIGFEIPDQFVVGYGLDYGEVYRNLRFVGVLKPEVYGARCRRRPSRRDDAPAAAGSGSDAGRRRRAWSSSWAASCRGGSLEQPGGGGLPPLTGNALEGERHPVLLAGSAHSCWSHCPMRSATARPPSTAGRRSRSSPSSAGSGSAGGSSTSSASARSGSREPVQVVHQRAGHLADRDRPGDPLAGRLPDDPRARTTAERRRPPGI